MRERAALAALALGCAAFGALCLAQPPLLFNGDSVHYLSVAEHLARGEGYRSSLHYFDDLLQPPLYPLLVAALIRCGLGAVQAAIALGLASLVGTFAGLVALHSLVWGARGRLYSALIAAVYPNVALAANLTLEPLFACALIWAVYFTYAAAQHKSAARAAAAGALLGASLLVRSEGVLSLGVCALVLAAWPSVPWRARLGWTAALAGVFALVVLPYGFWMQARLGYFELLPKVRYNLPVARIENHMAWPPDEERAPDRDYRTLHALMPDHATFVLDYAFRHPRFDPAAQFPQREEGAAGARAWLRSARTVLADAVWDTGLFHPLSLLLLAFCAWRVRRGATVQRWMAAGVAVQCGAHLLPALASGDDFMPRYLAASLLFAVPLVAGGAEELAARLGKRGAPAVAVLLLIGYGQLSARLARRLGGGPAVWARAAALERACAVIPSGARILSNHPRYAYLRGGAPIQVPYVANLGELSDYINHYDIDYAIFDSRTLRKHPSRVVRELLPDPASWPTGWTRIATLFSDGEPIYLVRVK